MRRPEYAGSGIFMEDAHVVPGCAADSTSVRVAQVPYRFAILRTKGAPNLRRDGLASRRGYARRGASPRPTWPPRRRTP